VARKYPALAKYFRVHDVTASVDLVRPEAMAAYRGYNEKYREFG
jgi:hypothetical protein